MGTGGYRYGAGRRGWRRRCEQSLALDVRSLHRKGLLRPGYFSSHWSAGEEPVGSIGVEVGSDALVLVYGWTPRGGEAQSIRCPIALEWMPCRFGGARPWFRCPLCARLCALVYGLSRDGQFACRLCLRLGYASESESPLARVWRKQRKLEARLGEEGARPKGMRWRTYERITERIAAIEAARSADCDAWLAGVLARSGLTEDELFGRGK